jgi:hypothetical protein
VIVRAPPTGLKAAKPSGDFHRADRPEHYAEFLYGTPGGFRGAAQLTKPGVLMWLCLVSLEIAGGGYFLAMIWPPPLGIAHRVLDVLVPKIGL